MKVIRGFAILLAFLAAGEVVSILTGHFLPGSVIGMMLLFVALCLKIVDASSVRDAASFLTDNMTMFFVPAFVGIMEQWGIIKVGFWGWLGVIVITTLLVMAVAGRSADRMMKFAGRREASRR